MKMHLFINNTYFRTLACLALVFLSFGTWAQDVSFKAEAPRAVSVGERFRLAYTLNARGSGLEPGSFDGFSVLSGPNASTSSSVQIINGQMTQSMEVSYTYILRAEKEGKFTIPPGKITVEGTEYTSNAVTIEVVKGRAPSQSQGNNRNNGTSGNTAAGAEISSDDIFLRMLVSKREVRKGEPVVATLKLYTRVKLADLGNFKAPSFNGFWSETLREAQNLSFQRENVNGEVYNAAVIQQHVLIPERTGALTIESAELNALVQVQVRSRRSRSLMDQFFGSYQNVEKLLTSAPVAIKVNALPAGAPAGYTGAVGKINLKASVEPQEAKTNEAINLKVTFSGTGNLKLIPEPGIKFPSDFEVYDPKVGNNYTAGANGFSGSKTYEYLIIPRHAGDFEIPEVRFTVFDLESNSYKTLTAGPFPIHVEKGEGGDEVTAIDPGLMKEDVRTLGSDIRYIKTGEVELREKGRPFFGSFSFFLSYALAIAAFFLAFILLRKQRRRSEDVVYMKNRKAGRVAQSRLKQAKTLLDEGKREPFYKEVLNALWGYLSDKLNIPRGELNKEKIRQTLTARNVNTELTQQLTGLMDRCEFAQFAPGSGEGELSGVYDEAARLIGELENEMK